MEIPATIYDEDYYEHGPISGKSNYVNYQWMPELTIPMAMTMVDFLEIKRYDTVLDYGCAKGYLVKALRLLYREAYGYDISDYAITHADPAVKDVVGREIPENPRFKYCIAKDVFEHVPEEELSKILERNIKSEILFSVIPLGYNGNYRAPANNLDVTHVTCMPEEWWKLFFSRCGWTVRRFTFRVDGIKDAYYAKFPTSHGFFVVQRERN